MAITNRSAILAPLILLALLALMTAWINHVVQTPAAKLDGSQRHDPDYIVRNFVTTQTDNLGHLHYKLAALEMKHFADDDSTHLQRPRYTQFGTKQFYTEVQAQRGYVSSDGERVQLLDNVKITRRRLADKAEMSIATQDLVILPKQDLLHTASPVVIRQAPKTVIYATGMVFDKKKHILTLLHQVRAHYEKAGATPAAPLKPKTAKMPGNHA